jgi:hypothetical protein
MLIFTLSLAFVSIWLGYLLLRSKRQSLLLKDDNVRLNEQIVVLEEQLQQALQKIHGDEETDSTTDGLLEKAVRGLVALGVPGIVLLVAVATSGFAGAAALTTALAALGGPFGMLGGIGVLGILVIVSRAVAKYGLPKISKLVIRGLVAKGYSMNAIRTHISKYPRWAITNDLRKGIEKLLRETKMIQAEITSHPTPAKSVKYWRISDDVRGRRQRNERGVAGRNSGYLVRSVESQGIRKHLEHFQG